MPKRKKFTAKELKHDPLRDWYVKQSEWARQHERSIYRTIYMTVAAIVLVVGSALGYSFWKGAAEQRLGQAFDIFNAQVGEEPPAGSLQRYYRTEEEKYRLALEAYQRVSNSWVYRFSDYAEAAEYYAAVCQLHLKPEEGQATLERIANDRSMTARLARLALAEHLLAKGDGARAESFYRRLLDDPGDFPKTKLQLELARALAIQGKKQDAINLYLQIAQENKKDPIAREALTQLAKLDPAALDKAPSEEDMQGETDVLAKYKKK
jgi:tetratricopeptide (TPR) repeat protein